MNEQFYDLPKEKQMRIINAGLEIFSRNDYKRAVTDDIAAKAGISKGLLFYYFHNKKTLFMFLFDYASNLIKEGVLNQKFEEITDFFELIEYAARRKLEVTKNNPYVMDFIIKCYYSCDEAISEELNPVIQQILEEAPKRYFENVDLGKFKDDVKPQEIYYMLTWMEEGYVNDRKRAGASVNLTEVMELFHLWEKRLKQIAYREEFLVDA